MRYNFDVSINPRGICPAKLSRDLKVAFGLPRKPRIEATGRRETGSDNLVSGLITVITPNELTPAQFTALNSAIVNHDPCPPVHSTAMDEVGVDVDDLEDLLATSTPGQIVFVRDLARVGGEGRGTLVYRGARDWRRVSNDQVVS